ncbi:hypothetical protein HA402_014167 [Bradysia odoriphaga]|nr:hypothetical protein HA402_014167 [Bradysia odoriphaga]
MKPKSEFVLKNLPSDYISSIKFHRKFGDLLLVSSWDCAVRLYDVDSNALRFKWVTADPILDSLFLGPSHIAYGGVDGIVKVREAETSYEVTIGTHNSAVKIIDFLPRKSAILSGSWDKTVKMWDLRVEGACATYEQCDGKVYSMSCLDEKIAVGTSGSKALIWDLRNMKTYMILHRLNHRVNCIALSPNKQCYAIGHTDGRVAVSYIDRDPEIRKLKTTFRCHRMIKDEFEHIFGVTAVRFYNGNGIFATGGGNGFVNIWDSVKKKHLCRYPRHHLAVTSMDFSPDLQKLAVACSEQTVEPCLKRPLEVLIKVWNVNDRKFDL